MFRFKVTFYERNKIITVYRRSDITHGSDLWEDGNVLSVTRC